MDQELFRYIISKQGEWREAYEREHRDYKLNKNRNEKMKQKENQNKIKNEKTSYI